MHQSVPVFRNQYLGSSQTVNSGPIAVSGNKVVLTVTAINISGSTAAAYIDGSYDGVSWDENLTGGAGLAINAFGVPTPVSKSSLDYPFVRVRVVAASTTKFLFDATLAFSEQ